VVSTGGNATEAVGADVEPVIGDVVEMLGRYEPHDLADLALAVVAGQGGERVERDVFALSELAGIVEGGTLRVAEERGLVR
jgi:hypothetical protein